MVEGKVKYKVQNGIGYIVINNPQKMNSMDKEATDELFSILKSTEDNDEVKVLILSGEGDRAFMCGQDISTFKLSDIRDGKKLIHTVLRLLSSLESLSKPIIAAVNGLALGGGTEILLSCDIVVASEHARLAFQSRG